ncbi:putative zinc finger protein, partial [Orchesella cincta]
VIKTNLTDRKAGENAGNKLQIVLPKCVEGYLSPGSNQNGSCAKMGDKEKWQVPVSSMSDEEREEEPQPKKRYQEAGECPHNVFYYSSDDDDEEIARIIKEKEESERGNQSQTKEFYFQNQAEVNENENINHVNEVVPIVSDEEAALTFTAPPAISPPPEAGESELEQVYSPPGKEYCAHVYLELGFSNDHTSTCIDKELNEKQQDRVEELRELQKNAVEGVEEDCEQEEENCEEEEENFEEEEENCEEVETRVEKEGYPTKRVSKRELLTKDWCKPTVFIEYEIFCDRNLKIVSSGGFHCSICGMQFAKDDKVICKNQCKHVICKRCEKIRISKNNNCPLSQVEEWGRGYDVNTPQYSRTTSTHSRKVTFQSLTNLGLRNKCNICFERFSGNDNVHGPGKCTQVDEDSCSEIEESKENSDDEDETSNNIPGDINPDENDQDSDQSEADLNCSTNISEQVCNDMANGEGITDSGNENQHDDLLQLMNPSSSSIFDSGAASMHEISKGDGSPKIQVCGYSYNKRASARILEKRSRDLKSKQNVKEKTEEIHYRCVASSSSVKCMKSSTRSARFVGTNSFGKDSKSSNYPSPRKSKSQPKSDSLDKSKPKRGCKKRETCPDCSRSFSKKGNLMVHMRECHTNLHKFECVICGKNFKQKYVMMNHIRLHTKEKPYSCKQCGKSFALKQYLQTHWFGKHWKASELFHCPSCTLTFAERTSLDRHIQTVHRKKGKNEVGTAPTNMEKSRNFKCQVCSKAFMSKLVLHMHKNVHSEEKPFKCDVIDCEKETWDDTSWSTLVNVTFQLPATLKKHGRTHTGEKPFSCGECGERFDIMAPLENAQRKSNFA